MTDFGNDGAGVAGASFPPIPSEPQTRILLVEDDARFAESLVEAVEAVGLDPLLVCTIDDDFAAFTRHAAPGAAVVDLLLPTADAFRLGRWIGGLCRGPVIVVVPGTTVPTIPDATTDRLRVVRRPVAPGALARMLVQIVGMRRWNACWLGTSTDPDARSA
ncbi:MAG: hypothetical protein QM589_03790 [Thermomicrobiales bacterium]